MNSKVVQVPRGRAKSEFVRAARKLYEETDLEKLACDVGFRSVHQTDPAKLARQVDLSPARYDALVSHQKKHRDHGLAV